MVVVLPLQLGHGVGFEIGGKGRWKRLQFCRSWGREEIVGRRKRKKEEKKRRDEWAGLLG